MFAATAAFESRRIKVAFAYLGNPQIKFADSRLQAFGFEAVGIVTALWSTLVRLGVEKVLREEMNKERGEKIIKKILAQS